MATILVIDDEPSVRESVERVLTMRGHKVLHAANGTEAIRVHQQQPIDLIVTDIFMPEMDGVEVINHFRKSDAKLPILAISGNPTGDMLTVAKRLGVAGVLEKPFSIADLQKQVEDVLKSVGKS
jgi:CheY-like chemotaxis protein